MLTRDILNSHSVSTLKKEISKTNVKGYSKMKKADVIDLMMKVEHTDKFKHIKMADKKETPAKKTPVKKTPVKKETHKMPDGTTMTGATHSKDSVPVPKKKVKRKLPLKEDLLTLMNKFNKKYNAVEIKKQNLNKSNLKKFTDPYFKVLEKIEKELENVDDSIEFIKTNKKISSDFVDIRKNFLRRVKAQMKGKNKIPLKDGKVQKRY